MWVPLLVIILITITAAAGLFLSCANLFFRDVKYIVQVLLTFGIFFTPVLFEPAMLGPTGAQVVMLNPLAPLLEGIRLAVVQGHNLPQPLLQVTAQRHPGVRVAAVVPAVQRRVGGRRPARQRALFHRLEFVFAEYV